MTFTTKIDIKFAHKLQQDLLNQGFEFSTPPHTIFSARKKGVTCVLYESGSLVVQGKEMKEFIEFYLEPEVLETFQYTHPEAHLDLTPRIGMDEAGKGDFFGPLCIAALFADSSGIKELLKLGVKDSKRFSDDRIAQLAKKLKERFPYTTIRLFPKKYNELHSKFKNLNRLLGWAHASALGDLSQKTGCKKAILDQFAGKHLMENALKQKKIEIDFEQRVRGEEDLVVAAASILARSAFLDGMQKLSEEVGLELPKGANSKVISVGQKLIKKFGREVLDKTAKTHFKTMNEFENT